MDTEQILDLFSLGDEPTKKIKEGKLSAKKAIDNLEELWDESQYDDMHEGFLKSLAS